MAWSQYLKNIAFIGASGNLGSKTLDALLNQGKHSITVISRTTSSATFPDSVAVKKGELDDAEFLVSALQGQDIVVIMLAFAGIGAQSSIIEAAAKAGVKWVMPSQYGAPSTKGWMREEVPLAQMIRRVQGQIEEVGMKYVGVATNGWTDYSLQHGLFGIDLAERKAVVYDDSEAFNTISTTGIGRALAKFLALPLEQLEARFANQYLYLSSFHLTQPELFQAVLNATGTSEADWRVEHRRVQDRIAEGKGKLERGDQAGTFDLIYGYTFADGSYEGEVHREFVEPEDLEGVILEVARKAVPGGWVVGSTLGKQ